MTNLKENITNLYKILNLTQTINILHVGYFEGLYGGLVSLVLPHGSGTTRLHVQ